MSGAFIQPNVVSGAGFSGITFANHSAQKIALSRKSKLKTTRSPLRVKCMKLRKTWNPINNKKFETLSYVPPLSDESIAKEVDYILSKGWVPCLEFDQVGAVHRTNSRIPGYYDGRYWTLWKLPMFGCTDSAQVLREIDECKKTYPNAYIKLISFDGSRQCQCMSFVIQKPSTVADETA